MIEPFMALLLIAAPWIFGFSDVSSATAIAVAVGALMLLVGSMTEWRPALARIIPLGTHFGGDLLFAAVLILPPFVFGFSDNSTATWFMVIYGAIELTAALGTRWDPAEAEGRATTQRAGARHN
jgi:hypothetical protein